MKTKELLFIVICTVINTFACVIVISNNSNSLKSLFEISGTIGDTVGGISNFMIGLISVFLIYKTYKDQRSSTNATTLIDAIREMKSSLNQVQYNGKSALAGANFFLASINHLENDGLHDLQRLFVESLISKLSDFEDFGFKIQSASLTQHHGELVKNRFRDLIKLYFDWYSKIFDELLDYVDSNRGLNSNEISNVMRIHSINNIASMLKQYQDSCKSLEINGFVVLEKINGTLSIDEYANPPLNKELIKSIDFARSNMKIK